MTQGRDDGRNPKRQVGRSEVWSSAEGGSPEHFASVERTTVHGDVEIGTAYAAGPFKTPSRAGRAARALGNRVDRVGSSDKHRTNYIERKV